MVNSGQREPFAIARCEVSMALRPVNAVIIRYLQEGDDETLWPDFRFNRKKIQKHDGLGDLRDLSLGDCTILIHGIGTPCCHYCSSIMHYSCT